jgi:hypothetical protein
VCVVCRHSVVLALCIVCLCVVCYVLRVASGVLDVLRCVLCVEG